MSRKRIDSGAYACIINAEIGTVLAVMRRNARWTGRYLARDDASEHYLVQSLKSLRKKLFTMHQPWNDMNPLVYLQPFLDVICSSESSSPIAGVALSAVYNILNFELYDVETAHVADAMHHLVEGVTSCRFEVLDPPSEEVVLMKILQVLLAVMRHGTSRLLSDRDLCLLVNSGFQVVQQAVTKGEILQRTARQTMYEIVRLIFARLPQLCISLPKDMKNSGSASDSKHDVGFDSNLSFKGSASANGCSTSNGLEASLKSSAVDASLSKLFANGEREECGQSKHGKEGEADSVSLIEPYGIASIAEIFQYLCSLLDSSMVPGQDLRAVDEDIPLFALGLINSAVELGGKALGIYPELFCFVQDDLFRSLLRLALSSKNPLILSMVCSVVLSLYHHHRSQLTLQLESFFLCVIMRLAQGKYGATHQQQEVAMESLVDFCRQPTFMSEMYANYDCNILCNNLFEELGSLLSKSVFPVNYPLSALHVLSLEGLIAVISSMADRCNSLLEVPKPCIDTTSVSDFVPYWALKCDSWDDPKCWVEFVRRQKAFKQKLMVGTEHFNKDLKKGLEFLQEVHLLPEKLDPTSVACFFRYTKGLDKTLVGDFLGDPDEFALEVLEKFIGTFDFQGMTLDNAMRIFLETFRLPGEAQKIHRVMEAFAARYYEQSPEVLADKDAAFVLAYSLILLNTDQHNSQVKKKMSEEDFLRNNRSINGGKDLPREYLLDLYRSIARNEIKMSYENGAEVTASHWVGLLYRSTRMPPYILCGSQPFLDHDMFAVISGPTVAAISVVFDHAEDEEVLRVCEEGFLAVAKVASNYHFSEVVDDLVVSLCNFSALLNNPAGNREELLISFCEDVKACMATVMAFKIANSYGDHIRAGWRSVVDCILQLHKLGLLPSLASDAMGEEMDMHGGATAGNAVSGGGVGSTASSASAGNKKRTSGLMGRFSQLLYLESSEELNVEPSEEQVAAHQRTMRAMEACNFHSLISESKFLQAEALVQLAKAVIALASRSEKVGDEATAVFCLDLLIAMVLHNRDRILLLWHGIYEHISRIMQTAASPGLLVEKAVFGLLRICKRLLPYKEDLAEELLRSLQVILKLDACVADALCERITQEVTRLVKANARHIKSVMGWRTVTAVLSIAACHVEASEAGFEALSFIMMESAHLTPVNYLLFLDVARAFAEASTGGVNRSVRALDFMCESTACLIGWSSRVHESANDDDEEAKQGEFGDMWVRLVQSFRKLVREPRELVRNHAVICLQRSLSAAENMHLRLSLLGQVFDEVVIGILDDLMELAVKQSLKGYRNIENTLYLAMKLMSKVFLQFLEQFSQLPSFPSMWSAVLNHMGRCMKAKLQEKGSGDNRLQECIPELLKNMLLVMRARGVLVEGSTLDGYTVWELTWHYVQGIAPSLKDELFPLEATTLEANFIEASASTEQ